MTIFIHKTRYDENGHPTIVYMTSTSHTSQLHSSLLVWYLQFVMCIIYTYALAFNYAHTLTLFLLFNIYIHKIYKCKDRYRAQFLQYVNGVYDITGPRTQNTTISECVLYGCLFICLCEFVLMLYYYVLYDDTKYVWVFLLSLPLLLLFLLVFMYAFRFSSVFCISDNSRLLIVICFHLVFLLGARYYGCCCCCCCIYLCSFFFLFILYYTYLSLLAGLAICSYLIWFSFCWFFQLDVYMLFFFFFIFHFIWFLFFYSFFFYFGECFDAVLPFNSLVYHCLFVFSNHVT